ncbi:MAG TPA: YciI family protein [Candidatus Limnocylindrales bacterium]|nr:YciI family protein [Candidatus Limnocylindrales bacterium]
MKYLCMIYCDERALDALPRSEYERLVAEALAYDEELRRGGHFVMGQALERSHAAATLRVRSSSVATTDGPFAETKEQLGGFILVEARDLNEAIQLASRIPPARFGAVEVRPVRDLARPHAEGDGIESGQ